ncbi:hypothetical protein R6Q57_005323 [Mikania cordata]
MSPVFETNQNETGKTGTGSTCTGPKHEPEPVGTSRSPEPEPVGSPVDQSCQQTAQFVFISIPPSSDDKRVLFKDNIEVKPLGNDGPARTPKHGDSKVYSHPSVTGCEIDKIGPVKNMRVDEVKDNRYNSFKTCSVRREYYHPIRVNFFFAPWIALLFLTIGVPKDVTTNLPHTLWYVLMTPIFCLELKIYGQWMSGGQRRLSKVANPSNHFAVVGNFVGALLGASMGLKEGPIFFFAVGLAHYTVLFVTLYQRLPTNETLPKDLHPVFFLFVTTPSVASMAWAKINGSFDYGPRIAYFIALFLYILLAVRVNFFRGFKFSLAWWAYTFPMTGAAIATIRYSSEVPNIVTKVLSVTLAIVATVTVTGLLIITIVHAFVLRDLFPNDIGIAISNQKP